MANSRKLWSIAAGLGIAAAALIYAVFIRQPLQKITIADPQQAVFALVYVADALGYFEDAGLDVSYRKFTVGRDALTDVLEKKSDLALVYETPVVSRVYEGNDIGIIASLHYSTKDTAILGRKDRGIRTVSDLRGRKVGAQKGTSAEYFVDSLLTSENMRVSDIKLVNVNVEDAEKTYLDGGIDALSIWGVPKYLLNKDISQISSVIYSDVYTEMTVIAGDKSYIQSHGDTMIKLLAALSRAEEYYDAHKEESAKIISKRLADQSVDTARAILDSITVRLWLDNMLLSVLRQEAQWYRLQGIYKTDPPEFRDTILSEYLYKVRPTAVTIF